MFIILIYVLVSDELNRP